MTNSINIALAQINTIVGDLSGNTLKIKNYYDQAKKDCDLIIFPELAVTSYMVEDLLLNKNFQVKSIEYVKELAKLTSSGPAMIVGAPALQHDKLYNGAYFLADGKIKHIILKHHLPNHKIFDDKRIFEPAGLQDIIEYKDIKIGLLICEDLWQKGVVEHLATQNPDILISINSSPFEIDKGQRRSDLVKSYVKLTNLPFIYVNQVGGHDNVIFDGSSFVYGADGKLAAKLSSFNEELRLTHWHKQHRLIIEDSTIHPTMSLEHGIYQAAMMGLRDYVKHNGFNSVIIGLSGGIDSALVATIAADSLGPDHVHSVMMPSIYTSESSLVDAKLCAQNLGIKLDNIPIENSINILNKTLEPYLSGKSNITQENLQPRIRALILMALSNQHNHLLISTGNKSELAVGYTTLYGDMCGAYNPLKDIYKTLVYKLASWRNQNIPQNSLNQKHNPIPENILIKAPSAELKHNQTDQDSLPPYDLLDAILEKLIEQNLSISEIVAIGYELKTVEKISKLLYGAEYKRRQAPPGTKVTAMSFNNDRRYPITNKWNNN